MTPTEALAAALAKAMWDDNVIRYPGDPAERQAARILAALPEGWRLTDEPEWTVERLAAALHGRYFGTAPSKDNPQAAQFAADDAAAIIAAMREARDE